MGYRSASSNFGTGTVASTTVPSGSGLWDIAILDLQYDSNGVDSDATIIAAAPDGFTYAGGHGTISNSTRGRGFSFWKRLSGADSGSYTFGALTSTAWILGARLYTGRARVGNPIDGLANAVTAVANGGTSVATNNVLTSYNSGFVGNDVVVAMSNSTDVLTQTWGALSGYAVRASQARFAIFDKVNATPGAQTGTSACSNNGFQNSYQYALIPEGFASRHGSSVIGHAVSAGAKVIDVLALSPPVGSRVTIVACGKYDNATIPTIDQGFTLVGSSTGGTGSAAADTGKVFAGVYQKDWLGTESNPTLTPGGTAPDSWGTAVYIAVPSNDKAFGDPIVASAAHVKFIDDTSTATPLTGTAGSFATAPTSGDGLLAVGVQPTDAGTLSISGSISATGLSGGTQFTNQVAASAAGADMCVSMIDWLGFAGTASSAVTVSITKSGATNFSGLIALVSFRQITTVAPGDPPSLTATALTTTSVGLAWGAPTMPTGSGTLASFEVRVDGGTPTDVGLPVSGGGYAQVMSGLVSGTTYTFEVRSVANTGLKSGWSSVSGAPVVILAPPVRVGIINRADTSATLVWNGSTWNALDPMLTWNDLDPGLTWDLWNG